MSDSVKKFSPNLVSKGVTAAVDQATASNSLTAYFKGLKDNAKVDLANLKEYQGEFDRVSIAYLDIKLNVDDIDIDAKRKAKVVTKWLADAGDLAGKAESPFMRRAGKNKGKPFTKRDLESSIRGFTREWMGQYERYLKGTKRDSGKRTEKPTFVKHIEAAWPLRAALQKIETPTTAEVASIKLWDAVIDHAVASCPEALKLRNTKLANALKASSK
jgi:hypothetical protein